MSRAAKTPKKHVLSVRVTEGEWRLLQQALRKSSVDISTVLRQGLESFLETAKNSGRPASKRPPR